MEDTDEMMISVQKVKSLCYTINDSYDASMYTQIKNKVIIH